MSTPGGEARSVPGPAADGARAWREDVRSPRLSLEIAPGFEGGPRSLLWVRPPAHVPTRAGLLCVQPWLDESNFSRRLIVVQARRLAARGIAVLVADPFGTGDSAGELEQATLGRWLDDLSCAARLLRADLGPHVALGVWGVRGGALLAERVAVAAAVGVVLLLAWHPLECGADQLGPYRRLARLRGLVQAASATEPSVTERTDASSSTDPARHQEQSEATHRSRPAIGAGGTGGTGATEQAGDTDDSAVEVAGYRLRPAMIDALARLRRSGHAAIETIVVEGAQAPFWMAPDAHVGEALLDQTEARLEAWLAGLETDRVPGRIDGHLDRTTHHPDRTAHHADRITHHADRTALQPDQVAHDPAAPGPAGSLDETGSDAAFTERTVAFESGGRTLRGVLHAAPGSLGVVVVAGQPQTRVGSHRMFVHLARALARAGYPTLRYDLAGHGDSDGEPAAFDATPRDVRAAIAALRRSAPATRRVAVWGLCDGATAAALAVGEPPRLPAAAGLAGLVLLNPWVHDEALRARAVVTGHYRDRLRSAAFWRKVLAGELPLVDTAREALGHLRRLVGDGTRGAPLSPAARLRLAIEGSAAPACLLLSGHDLTASEMEAALLSDPGWRSLRPAPVVHRFPQADHTLSRAADLEQAIGCTLAFLRAVEPSG